MKCQPAPVFLPGESHGQRNLVGYSPWDRKVGHDWNNLACIHAQAEDCGGFRCSQYGNSLHPLVGSGLLWMLTKNMSEGPEEASIATQGGRAGVDCGHCWGSVRPTSPAVRSVCPGSQDWGGASWLLDHCSKLFAAGNGSDNKSPLSPGEGQACKLGTRAGGRAGAQRVRPHGPGMQCVSAPEIYPE